MNRLLSWIYKKLLLKELIHLSRSDSIVNVQTAKTMGILFDASSDEIINTILKYAENWKKKGKKVHLLGFIPSKSEPENHNFDSFNKKNLDWLQRPHNPAVNQFLKAPIDVLIIPVIDKPSQPICHLSAIHPAPIKTGPDIEVLNPYLDLLIDLKENKSLPFLLKQINVYLNLVNTKSKVEVPPKSHS